MFLMVQLPDDVIDQGYTQTRPYHYEQVFYSPSNDFKGTEKQFLNAGLAYRYNQLDKHVRIVDISGSHPREQVRLASLVKGENHYV
jgi:hypothetical protein